MWWLPRQPCRGFLVRSVSLSLPERCPCSAILGCFRDRRDTTPPPPTLSFFPLMGDVPDSRTVAHTFNCLSLAIRYRQRQGVGHKLRNPSGFLLGGGSTRTSWRFFLHISWGGLLMGNFWLWDGSLHFAGLPLRSLDPSSDCLPDTT